MSAIKRYIENEAERLGVTFDEVVAAHQFLPLTPDEDAPPSCFTCKHVKTWHQSQTRDEPEDSGWECNHPDQVLVYQDWVEPDDSVTKSDKAFAAHCAGCCHGYTFFDWDVHRAAQDDALATEALSAQAKYAKVYKEFGI